jgi:hypothetical protein
MTDCPSVHASISRKRRKEKLDSKRNKRQCISIEDGIRKDKEAVGRHKRYLILKQGKDSKRARTKTYVMSQECNGGSSSNDISSVEIYVSSQEKNSKSSRSNINSIERYVTTQEQNNESSSNDVNCTEKNNESSSSNVTNHQENKESSSNGVESASVNSEI